MNNLIAWLVQIERGAGDFYKAAAIHFEGNAGLSDFLARLAEDEAWHLHVIENAAELIHKSEETIQPAISLDDTTRSRIEDQLSIINRKLVGGDITIADLLEYLAAAEFSEWNEIFLYVINLLKNEDIEFQTVASKMQSHLTHIEAFIRSMPEGDKYGDMIKRLPHVWTANILVVDNEPAIARFLSMLLEKEGLVHIAENGQEALDKMSRHYFDVILTDLNMPVMDGISLYRHAAEKSPDIGNKFIFFTGAQDQKHVEFFDMNKLRYLLKPAPINEILKNVYEILDAVERT